MVLRNRAGLPSIKTANQIASNLYSAYQCIMNTLLNRITIDANVCHGKPCIRGLRYPVEMILELLSGNTTEADLLKDYEDLQPDDIKACFLYASKLSQVKGVYQMAS